MEVWKDIPGYEGKYQISNLGNVKSLFFGPKNISIDFRTERLLSISKSSTGYMHVQLYKNGKPTTVNIHKLVAEAFVPNPDNKPEINHIDANRSNNKSTNLEWVTHSENIRHGMVLGNINPRNIKKKTNYELYTVLQYSLIGEFIREWNCINDIVNELGMKYNLINTCLNGHRKSSYGYMWIKRFDNEEIQNQIKPRIDMTGKTQHHERREIAQYDKEGNLIRIWKDYIELANHPSYGKNSLANIMKCATGKRKSSYGFIWKYI